MPNPDPLIAYLDAVRRRCDAATPGPWRPRYNHLPIFAGRRVLFRGAIGDEVELEQRQHDSWFVAEARTDVPRLEDMLRVTVEALEAMSEGPFELDPHKFSGAVLDRLRRIVEGESGDK